MAKIITKAVTRLQKFLAAIAGDAVAPTPITNQEKLLYNIAEEMRAASSGGGGVLVVNATPSEDAITLDKTWQEIKDADAVSIVFDTLEENRRNFFFCSSVFERVPFGGGDTQYVVKVHDSGDSQNMEFIASSESGYPSYTYE